MRPKTKDEAKKITFTLSRPARDWLLRQAMDKGTSQTQIVEDLILAKKPKKTSKTTQSR